MLINLVNFGPVALFIEAEITAFSRKPLEKVDNFYIKSTNKKCLTSNQQTSELVYGFEMSEHTKNTN